MSLQFNPHHIDLSIQILDLEVIWTWSYHRQNTNYVKLTEWSELEINCKHCCMEIHCLLIWWDTKLKKIYRKISLCCSKYLYRKVDSLYIQVNAYTLSNKNQTQIIATTGKAQLQNQELNTDFSSYRTNIHISYCKFNRHRHRIQNTTSKKNVWLWAHP